MNIRKIIKEEINDFEWVEQGYSHLLGDYRVGERNLTVSVVDVNVSTNRVIYHLWASRGYKGTFTNVNRGSMEITTLEEKIDNGQWSKMEDVNESNDFEWTSEAEIPMDDIINRITDELRNRMVGEHWEGEELIFNPIGLAVVSYLGTISHYIDGSLDTRFKIRIDYKGDYRITAEENRRITDRETFTTIEKMMEWVFEYVMFD